MRKHTLFEFSDWILWTIIALLPLIYVMFYYLSIPETADEMPIFATVLNGFFDNTVNSENVLYNLFNQFFNNSTYEMNINCQAFINFLVWFVMAQIMHVVCDVLLFVPKFCSKVMDNFGGKC